MSIIKTYWNNNETLVKEEYYELNGKKNGIYKSWYMNGKLEKEINYIKEELQYQKNQQQAQKQRLQNNLQQKRQRHNNKPIENLLMICYISNLMR